jgi:hypothetical protein
MTYVTRGPGRGFGGEASGRRRYVPADRLRTCEDCGRHRPVTLIRFWSTGMEYVVCSECIEPYRSVILHPDAEWSRPPRLGTQ